MNGQVRWKISEEEIADLYSRGFVTRDTHCKVTGTNEWRDVNEYFPTLKYRPVGAPIRIQVPAFQDSGSVVEQGDRQRNPRTNQMAWFVTGIVAGMLSLLTVQKIQNSKTPFEELKIAESPTASLRLTPSPSVRPISTVKQPPRATAPVQFFDGQWTSRVTVTTPRPRIIQPTQSIPSAPVMQVSTAAAMPKIQEVSVFLDRQQQIKTRSGTYQIFVHDHGSETISVSVAHGPYTKVKKVLGTDTIGDNKALIYSDGNVQFFHINTPRAPQNCCLIEVVFAR